MKLTDMKLPKKSKKELKTECSPIGYDDGERWPYGLRIRFEKEQVAKIPKAVDLKVGDIVSVSGVGKVVSVRTSEQREGKDDHTVEIQLEKIGVSTQSQKKLGDMGMAEYSRARDEGQGR